MNNMNNTINNTDLEKLIAMILVAAARKSEAESEDNRATMNENRLAAIEEARNPADHGN